MKMRMLLLFILVLVLKKMTDAQCCTPFPFCSCEEKLGELISEMQIPYIFLGEYLNMTCKLSERGMNMGYNSSDLYFTYGTNIRVNENETYIIDSASLGLSRLIRAVPEKGSHIYSCKVENGVEIDYKQVDIEYPLRPVKNIRCKIYNWDESMNCTWDLGVKYSNNKNINITLLMEDGFCPSMHPTYCFWNKSDGVEFNRSPLNFSVYVTNKKHGKSEYTGKFIRNYNEYVKPTEVDYFLVNSVNSTCAMLEWRHPKTDKDKIFIVSLSSKWNDDRSEETYDRYLTVCNLRPNTHYNFTIKTRPGEDIGYFSDPVVNNTKTETDRPASPPEILGDTYSVNKEDCLNNVRTVTVSWKAIPEEHENGPLIGYFITALHDKSGEVLEYHINDTDQFYQTMEIPCDQKLTVSIKSWGVDGYSEESSVIIIPKASYLSDSEIVLISLGVFIIIVVMIFALSICIRRLVIKIKKLREPLQINTIPVNKTYQNMMNGSATSNKDSGHDSYSSEPIPSSTGSIQFLIPKKSDQPYSSTSQGSYNVITDSDIMNTEQHQMNDNEITTSYGKENDDLSNVSSCHEDEHFHSEHDMSASDSSISCCSEKIVLNCNEDEDGYMDGNSNTDSYDDAIVSYVVQENEDSSITTTNTNKSSTSETCSHDGKASQKSFKSTTSPSCVELISPEKGKQKDTIKHHIGTVGSVLNEAV